MENRVPWGAPCFLHLGNRMPWFLMGFASVLVFNGFKGKILCLGAPPAFAPRESHALFFLPVIKHVSAFGPAPLLLHLAIGNRDMLQDRPGERKVCSRP